MDEPLRLTLRSDAVDWPRVEETVVRYLESQRVPAKTTYGARVVVEEILMNSTRHGRVDGRPHEIRLEVRVALPEVALSFEDDGREFDPRKAPETSATEPLEARRPGGLGLKLVRAMANRFDYRRDADGKNRIEIRVSDKWGGAS